MKDLDYSMVDVALSVLKYSKGRWTPEEVLTFSYTLETINLDDEDTGKPQLFSLKGGKQTEE
jgi:hypothetical protein